jgi:hypothetical protein
MFLTDDVREYYTNIIFTCYIICKKNESQSLDDVVGYRLGDPVNPFANGRVIKKLTN